MISLLYDVISIIISKFHSQFQFFNNYHCECELAFGSKKSVYCLFFAFFPSVCNRSCLRCLAILSNERLVGTGKSLCILTVGILLRAKYLAKSVNKVKILFSILMEESCLFWNITPYVDFNSISYTVRMRRCF